MSETAHSEYLHLRKVAIKSVKDSFISDEFLKKQWINHNFLQKPDFNASLMEYANFESLFLENGIEIDHFDLDEHVTIDSIYCRDASIVTDFGAILCSMGKSERRNEPKSQRKLYEKLNIPILAEIEPPGTIEGGDVAWLDNKTLAIGYTYRTNESGIDQLKKILEPKGVQVLVAQLPHYKGRHDVFHLMSVLSPIDKDLAVVYSPLMPIQFRNELLDRGFEFVEVPDDEFESMGCNVLAIAPRKCVMVKGNPRTVEALINKDCEVHLYKGDEISIKGGGGPTCLTRPILRSY
jgi:N-dimethylarginine dimethylaminohydrolase